MDVELLLTWLPGLYFRRKELVVLFHSSFIVTRSISIVLIVDPISAVESVIAERFYEQSSRESAVFEGNVIFFAAFIAAGNIVIGVAEVDNGIEAHISSDSEGMLKEQPAAAHALVVWVDTDRTHSEHRFFVSVLIDEFRA